MKIGINKGFLVSFGASLAGGVIIGLIVYIRSDNNIPLSTSWGFGVAALVGKIFELINSSGDGKVKKEVHKKYLDQKTDYLKSVLKKKNKVAIEYAINDVHTILRSMKKCCYGKESERIESYKGGLGNLLTKIETNGPESDESLAQLYNQVLELVQGINDTLGEL